MTSHVVAIHSAPGAPRVGRIEFSEPQFRRGEFRCTGMLELDGDEWLVEMEMIEPYRSDMLGFFEEIAAAAETGWPGTKSWESEFTEMRIDATNDGRGLTELRTFINWIRPIEQQDEQSGVVVVRSGELPRTAEAMSRFLRLAHGSRFTKYGDS